MSRATQLAALPRYQLVQLWQQTHPAATGQAARMVAEAATKEQLAAAIATAEEETG